MNAHFDSYKSINQAELISVQHGLTGNIPEHFFDSMAVDPDAWNVPALWLRFAQAALRFKNTAVSVRALELHAKKSNGNMRPLAWLILGHYLRFSEARTIDAAKAYAECASGNDNDALCAIIALHRLYRTDPQCSDITDLIHSIRLKKAFKAESTDVLDKRLAEVPGVDALKRADIFCEMALSYLMNWGDVGSAFECLLQAGALNKNQPLLATTLAALVMAMPDNAPVVSRGIQLLVQLQKAELVDDVVRVCEAFSNGFTDGSLLLIAEVYALRLHQQERAAFYLFRCLVQNPAFGADALVKNTWISKHAAGCSEFREALLEGLKIISDEKLSMQIFAYLGRFAPDNDVRRQAIIFQIRLLTASGFHEQALRAISGAVLKFEPEWTWQLYDLLLELIRVNGNAQDTAWNAQLLHIADTLCRKNANVHQFHCFLEAFLDMLGEFEASSNDSISLVKSIRKRFVTQSVPDKSIDDFQCLPENMPILASCLELIKNDRTNQAMQAFFAWCENGVEFETAFMVLCKLDSVISGTEDTQKEQILSLLQRRMGFPNDSRLLALAIVVCHDDCHWIELLQKAYVDRKIVLEVILRYLPWVSGRFLDSILITECIHRLEKTVANRILHENLASCMLHDVLMKQVIEMADSEPQQKSLMDEMDSAIAEFDGDASQKAVLYAQKYRYAEQIADEKTMLNTIRDMLELDSSDSFAASELKKIDPAPLKPHAQILYYQLRIFIETTPSERLRFQAALALLYTKTSQFNNAITLYHTIIDEHPEYLDARYRLLDLLLSLENWKSAENVLLALVNAETSPENRYQSLVRLAILQNEHMMMPSRALLTFFAALDTDPKKLNALHPKLCDISERLHSFSALLDKYEDFALHGNDYETRKIATRLLAKVYSEHIHNPALACNVLDEFYAYGGKDDIDFLRFASEFYQNSLNWTGYVQVRADMFRFSQDATEKLSLSLNLADIFIHQLGDVPNALRFLEEAVKIFPTKSEQWLDIADLFIECDKLEKAVEPLIHAADTEQDCNQKVLIILETSRLLARLDNLVDAANYLHVAVSYRPSVQQLTPVVEELISMTTVHQNKDIFNMLCKDLVGVCTEDDKTPLLLQQALTLAKIFNDTDAAKRLIASNVSSFKALDAEQSLMLLQVLTLTGNSAEAIQIADSIMQNFVLSGEQKLTCMNCLLSCAVDVNDVDTVKATAESIVEIDPDNVVAIFQLIQLNYQTGHWDQAAERIRKLLPLQERLTADNALLMHYYYGEILHAAELDEDAVYYLDNALSIRPDFRPAVDLKLGILIQHEKWSESLPVFQRLLSLTDDDEVLGAIHKRIAEVYHFYLNEPENALIEYEQALALGGDVEDVPIRLLQLYQDTELWQKAAMTAQILAYAQVSSANAKCDYLVLLGDIQCNHLEQVREAINTYLEAFMLNPLREDCFKPLVNLLFDNREWDNICTLFNHLSSLVESQPDSAINELKWLAEKTKHIQKCREAIQNAQNSVQKSHPNVRLIEDEVSNGEFSAKTVITSPTHATLTIDSSLLRNPEIQPPDKNSQHSVMAAYDSVPETTKSAAEPKKSVSEITKTAPEPKKSVQETTKLNQVIPLPDDAFLPVEDVPEPVPVPDKSISVPAPAARMSNLFPPISNRASSKGTASKSIESLTFTVDDIQEIGKDAPLLVRHAVDDILDIASIAHEFHPWRALPPTISEIVVQELMGLAGNSLTPNVNRLLAILGGHSLSPALRYANDSAFQGIPNLAGELSADVRKLQMLLRRNDVQIRLKPENMDSGCTVSCSCPPVVFVDPASLTSMTEKNWIAKLTYALILTKPENLLCAALKPTEVYQYLHNAYASMDARELTDLSENEVLQYREMLAKAGFVTANMPHITDETLSLMKSNALNVTKNAIFAAFVLSQSLIDCLMILTERENMRFPTTLSSLKSAMKRSSLIRELICFALSPASQRIFDKVFR